MVSGEDVAANHLLGVAARAQDLRPAARRIRDLLIRGDTEQFESHGAFQGSFWPPLADSTIARKEGGGIGVETGALKASIEGGRGRKTSATKRQVLVGTRVFYARWFAGGKKDQPPRQLFGANQAQIVEANLILRRYITKGIV